MLACSPPSEASSPSHELAFSAVCFTPRARRRGLLVLPSCLPRWLSAWLRSAPNRLYTLLASFHTTRQTRSRSDGASSSTNTVPSCPILLLHYLLPSRSGSGRFRRGLSDRKVDAAQFQSRVRAQAASDHVALNSSYNRSMFQSRVRAQAASDPDNGV